MERLGPGDRQKPRRQAASPAAKARARQLAASGMPMQMAMAVAHGKLSLNDALERMARSEAVDKLVERHSLSRGLAMQIALGQIELAYVLAQRRFIAHREQYRDRSVLDEVAGSGAVLSFALHGQRKVVGRIDIADAYLLRIACEDGSTEDLHKLQVKFVFPAEEYKRVRKVLKSDKEVPVREPIPRPQDRYTCSDRRLFRYLDEALEVVATTLEGDQLRGQVAWFSRFEFGLQLKGGASVTVMRHALHDLREV